MAATTGRGITILQDVSEPAAIHIHVFTRTGAYRHHVRMWNSHWLWKLQRILSAMNRKERLYMTLPICGFGYHIEEVEVS